MGLASIRILRPREWVKNFFVLAPLIFANKFGEFNSLINSFVAFTIFCVASSAVYILNDLVDFKSDMSHPIKSQSKPLTSGLCGKKEAKIFLIVLYFLLASASFISPEVTYVAVFYVLLNVLYSFFLKNIVFIDITTIALGFVLRVFAGAIALKVPLTHWTFITTFFLSLFLASIKRHQELKFYGTIGRKVLGNYSLKMLEIIVVASGLFSVSFYLIFVILERNVMALTVPFVLIGVSRYYQIFKKNKLGVSPTETVFSDAQLFGSIMFWVLSCIFAMKLS